MIPVTRSAYTENANGGLSCTIQIRREDVAAVLVGQAAVVLPATFSPNPPLPDQLQRYRGVSEFKAHPFKPRVTAAELAAHIDALAPKPAAPPPPPPDGPDQFSVDIPEPGDEPKPPPQTIGATGWDDASVLAHVANAAPAWDHRAAPFIQNLYLYEPFQIYAVEILNGDPFCAPMAMANQVIRRCFDGDVDADVAMSRLSRAMDKYEDWAAQRGTAPYPVG